MAAVRAFAAESAKAELKPFEYDPGELQPGEVEVNVESCGICHSDLSMLNNDWGMTGYPFVPGHEAVGTVAAKADDVKHLKVGQRVGVGWMAQTCLTCGECVSGNHNRCPDQVGTIVGRHGAFADRVRVQGTWAIPLPDGIDPKKAGPMFCGGITVFNPVVRNGVKPTDHVAVVGIGGLGHLALQFLRAWGCEVTAFSTSANKAGEAKRLGAHHFLNSKDDGDLEKAANSFDLILVTVNAPLDWDKYVAALKPGGKVALVGVAPEVKATVFPLIAGEKSLGGSPLGAPATYAEMMRFAARHNVAPVTEHFPMSKANEALQHLHEGKARYRIVLENDFA